MAISRSLSFTQIKSFYDVLVEYKNEDGYSLANAGFAAARIKLPSASARSALKTLQALGCICVYTAISEPEGETTITSEYVNRSSEKRLSIIKITNTPLTKEAYGLYLVEKAEAE